MLSKKHYVAIAETINNLLRDYPQNQMGILQVMYRLEQVFQRDNPRFKYETFREARLRGVSLNGED